MFHECVLRNDPQSVLRLRLGCFFNRYCLRSPVNEVAIDLVSMESVCVYCGSSMGNQSEYVEAARRVGSEVARRGKTLVYGAGNVGLMGVVAEACLAEGGRVVGVITQYLVDKEVVHRGLDELIIVETMSERKTKMLQLADAQIALAGGVGTLEEIAEAMTLMQLRLLSSPCGFLNTRGFYDPFFAQLEKMVSDGFLKKDFVDTLILSSDPVAVLDKIEHAKNTFEDKWLA